MLNGTCKYFPLHAHGGIDKVYMWKAFQPQFEPLIPHYNVGCKIGGLWSMKLWGPCFSGKIKITSSIYNGHQEMSIPKYNTQRSLDSLKFCLFFRIFIVFSLG